MGLITITRRLEFDYGHRVLGHEGKCKNLHGHRGIALITVQAPRLDNIGRVVDFSVIKEKVGGWIGDYWDHKFLVHPDDPLRKLLMESSRSEHLYVMPDCNPTAENMAAELAIIADRHLPGDLKVVRVRFYETPNSYADFYPDGDNKG